MPRTPEPTPMPEHSALLAVDMIESGSSGPEHLGSIPTLVHGLVQEALHTVGLNDEAVRDDQFTGDGFLRAYPSRFLPALVDMISVLDELLAAHNRSAKPEIRLRVAVHLGPLPSRRGFHRPNIDVNRLLDADAFKQVVRHCREHITTEAFTSALVVSDDAYRAVFQGDYTHVVTREDFASLLITNNEFSEYSWVRITGVHPTQISSISLREEPAQVEKEKPDPNPDKAPGERSIHNSGDISGSQVTGDSNTFYATPNANVSNYIGGANTGVQTGTFNGNFNQGEARQ